MHLVFPVATSRQLANAAFQQQEEHKSEPSVDSELETPPDVASSPGIAAG